MRSISNLLSVIFELPRLDVPTRDRARDLLWRLDRHAWAEALLA